MVEKECTYQGKIARPSKKRGLPAVEGTANTRRLYGRLVSFEISPLIPRFSLELERWSAIY
jgi:hypothetical protein